MSTVIINRQEMSDLLLLKDVIQGVEHVYRLKANHETAVWPHICYDFLGNNGVMDIKSGYVGGQIELHGAKLLNTFRDNVNLDIPVFNGLMMIFDSKTGKPLGMMDASYVTCMRTGVAGALGAKVLARKNSETLFVLGTGKQAIYQVAASLYLMPQIKKVYIASPRIYDHAVRFCQRMPDLLKTQFKLEAYTEVNFEPVKDMEQAIGLSDIIITVTPSKTPIIKASWIKSGSHISCVGSDMHGKIEVESEIFNRARVFVDDRQQCIQVGEMELAIQAGLFSENDIIGQLGDVLNGKILGRRSAEDITLFDTTGIALLDIVTGKLAIDGALEKGMGITVEF